MRIQKKKIIIFGLAALGAVSLLAQVILIRELVSSFYGNEIFIGLTLAFWLIGTGLGSWFLAGWSWLEKKYFLFWFLLVLWPAVIMAARLLRLILSPTGAAPNLGLALAASALVVLPLALLLGAQFVVLARYLVSVFASQHTQTASRAVSQAYVYESLGFFFGALAFNLVLFKLSSLSLVWSLGVFLVFGWLIFIQPRRRGLAFILLIALLFLFFKLSWLNLKTEGWRYHGQELIASQNTPYGVVDVTKTGEARNFYYNGQLVDSTENQLHNELLAHIPMLAAPQMNNILVIGNGFTGLLEEIKKYSPPHLVYLELDKDYFSLGKKLSQADLAGVEVYHQDARQWLARNQEKFDVIIINYSNPTTLAENRFFTNEFFSLLAKHLPGVGLVAFKINTTPNYTQGATGKMLSIIYHTLRANFPYVYALPDNEVIFLASPTQLNYAPKSFVDKYQYYHLDNSLVTPAYLDWRFTSDRAKKLNYFLKQSQRVVNSDFRPILYYQQLKIFLAQSGIKSFSFWARGIGLALVLAVVGLIIFSCRRRRGRKISLLFISALPEFSLLSLEVILILMFQTFHGYLYTQLSLIIALILVGLAGGAWLADHWLDRQRLKQLTFLSYGLIVFVFALNWLLFARFSLVFGYKFTFYLLSLLLGFAVGTKFPVINAWYLAGRKEKLGAVYGADLFGAAFGAAAAGLFLLPLLGVVPSLGLLTGLTVLALGWLAIVI